MRSEALRRANLLLEGVERYRAQPPIALPAVPPVIWRKHGARLLDCGATAEYRQSPQRSAAPLLLIPSLVNRYTILDLQPGRSFARFLSARGIRVLLLDWDAPGAAERSYDCAAYTTEILIPALEFLHGATAAPLHVAGYCMGGVFALALAVLQPKRVATLSLLATPWDFDAPGIRLPKLKAEDCALLETWLSENELLSAEALQSLFYLHDPWLFYEKFSRFGQLSAGGEAFSEFLALEHWVNDGVPLAAPVARECLIGWGQENGLMKGKWRIGKRRIVPEGLTLPVFLAVPRRDRIVPPACTLALAEAVPQAVIAAPDSGHVGMMVGRRARKELWEPFAEFLEARP